MANILLNQFRHMDKSNMQTGLKLVLMYLCDLANKDTQIAFPAIATIAREIGMSTKQVRRWTHDLEKRGLIKIVENRFGGDKGKTCRYKITLPVIQVQTQKSKKIATPVHDRYPSRQGTFTPPAEGSQTVVEPLLTNKDIIKKFGLGWEKNPDTAYIVGRELGINAYPGEETYTLVGRIYNKLNSAQKFH
jgi:hypothetical protein